jgi:hypothetical protein
MQEIAKRCGELTENGKREDAHWLKMLQGSDYLSEKSTSCSLSNDSYDSTITDTNEIGTHDWAAKGGILEQEKAITSVELASANP